MTIPDEAIEAAARALVGFDDKQPHDTRDQARVAIEAAMPAIREALAQEIESAIGDDYIHSSAFAAIVRGGTA